MFAGCRHRRRRFCCPAAATVLALASFGASGAVSERAWTPAPAPREALLPGDLLVTPEHHQPIGIGAAPAVSGRTLVIRSRLAYTPPSYCG